MEEEQGEFEVPEIQFDNSLYDRELQKKMVLVKMLPLKMITTIAFKLLHRIMIKGLFMLLVKYRSSIVKQYALVLNT